MSTVSCHICNRKGESETIVKSMETIEFYDAKSMQYVGDGEPVKDAWEMVALDKSITEKNDDGFKVDVEKAVFFCPNCPADLENV